MRTWPTPSFRRNASARSTCDNACSVIGVPWGMRDDRQASAGLSQLSTRQRFAQRRDSDDAITKRFVRNFQNQRRIDTSGKSYGTRRDAFDSFTQIVELCFQASHFKLSPTRYRRWY